VLVDSGSTNKTLREDLPMVELSQTEITNSSSICTTHVMRWLTKASMN
jgi:hypothetical protein